MVITAGEALVDWVSIERGASLEAAAQWVKAPGGAPLNVAVGLARLGVKAAFAGVLADDPFGRWLEALMAAEGVDTALVRRQADRQTRMAYVTTTEAGDRHLAGFSTVACADEALDRTLLPADRLKDAQAFCFGSLILGGAAREAVLEAASVVKAAPGLSVFDPNIRPVLWPDEAELRAVLDRAMAAADLVKLGDDELRFLTGDDHVERAADAIVERYRLAALVVTLGAAGAYFRTSSSEGRADSYAVEAVDATGAGDGFVAGLLAGLAGKNAAEVATLPEEDWEALLARANAVGALATTRPGAMAALPTLAELEAFLAASR